MEPDRRPCFLVQDMSIWIRGGSWDSRSALSTLLSGSDSAEFGGKFWGFGNDSAVEENFEIRVIFRCYV